MGNSEQAPVWPTEAHHMDPGTQAQGFSSSILQEGGWDVGIKEFAPGESESKDILISFYLDTSYLQIRFCGGLRQKHKSLF